MHVYEIFSNQSPTNTTDDPLTGYINIKGLEKLLPDVSNMVAFESAIMKIRLGRAENLTFPEQIQLSQAFISLLGLNPEEKSQIMRLLSSIKVSPEPRPQGNQNIN